MRRHRDNKGGHGHIILETIDDNYVSVGTTSQSKKGKNSTNYNCKGDELGNDFIKYLRRQGTVDLKTNYSKDSWQSKITNEGYLQAKEYGRRAKEKYLKKKNKNDK